MKINFPALFQTSLHKYNLFFLFGNDALVFERALSFLQKKLLFPLHMKTEESILTPSPLQPSLFETQQDQPLTLIPHVTDKILNHLEQLKEGVFILTSEKARAQSKLVTYFTQSSDALAIAAYAAPITKPEFAFLVEDLNIPSSFQVLLFNAYQNDYQGLLATLKKIKLYGEVPEASYASFLESSASFDDLTPLLHAVLSRDAQKATETFSALGFLDLISLLRTLMRSFQTLFELMSFKKASKPIPWQSLTVPVFFKDQPLYEMALARWQGPEVQAFLETLLTLERRIKLSTCMLPQVKQELLFFLCKREVCQQAL